MKYLAVMLMVSSVVFAQDYWTSMNGPGSASIYEIVSLSSQAVYAAANTSETPDYQGVFFTSDNGSSWQHLYSDQGLWDMKRNSQGHLWIGTDGMGVFNSTDGGTTWNQTEIGMNKVVRCLYVDSADGIFAGVEDDGIYYSADGSQWDLILPHPGNYQAILRNAAGDTFTAIYGEGLFRSAVLAPGNWVTCENGLSTTNFRDLAITEDGTLFVAAMNDGVFKSTDNGETFVSASSGIEGGYPFELEVTASGEIFAATYFGVYRSANMGDSWENISSGVGSVFVRSIGSAPDGELYIGLNDGNAYSCTNFITSTEPRDAQYPQHSRLIQNYPNPFNPTTTIRFGLAEEADFSISIIDARGRSIRALVSGHSSAGWYDVKWDGLSDLGLPMQSGIYLARLESGQTTQLIKLTLLK